ncbi:MAG: hypothetical protein ACRERR_09025 [Moraxellaceae bacterium]
MKQAKIFLQLYAIAHIVGGLLLPWLTDSILFTEYNRALAASFGLNDAASLKQARFLTGLMGPTIASWGLLMLLMVSEAFARPQAKWWWGLLLVGLLWAPYDSFLSWQQGVYLNVAINALSFLALLVPLWLVRHNFLQPKASSAS